MMLASIIRDFKREADPKKAKANKWFFKTGPGQYGEGDEFIGLDLPKQRILAKKYADLSFRDLKKLLQSQIHEYRLTALIILVNRYRKADANGKKKIFLFYQENIKSVNNWDLVDTSAPYIVGDYLIDKDRRILYRLAKSKNLWERRIAMVASFSFIKNHQFKESFQIAKLLMEDKQDLIHKAMGWMLREVGKKDMAALEKFLGKYKTQMPRTSLRYAIERMSRQKKQFYLK